MIQFNLLPDIKQQYIKARRLKRMVYLISAIASGASLVIFVLTIITVDVVQKKSMRDLTHDITASSNTLKSVPNLDKILTVQNQLNTLTSLHDKKVVASRLFTYASQITPDKVTISSLNVDFQANTIVINGQAPDLDTVNTYTDTLKATTYKTDAAGAQATKAFSSIVLSSFGRDSKGATYTIDLNFDPVIFDSAHAVTLTIPSGIQNNTSKLFEQQAGS